MLFHEVYGSYYDATAAILRRAVAGTLTDRALTALVQEQAFSESLLSIPRGLKAEKWLLLRRDLTTPIQQPPTMPLTLLQRRWLKALLLDARIRLFDPDLSGLEDVEPLFTPDMFVYFDRYGDGDDYADPGYVARFRTILRALRQGSNLYVRYETGRGEDQALLVTPHRLEYSEKDDRFRLVVSGHKRDWIVNLSRLSECVQTEAGARVPPRQVQRRSLTFELVDERNALERVLLHFSHLQKETERLDDAHYRVTVHYDPQDETEMVIRMLSFGPVVRVTAPAHFIDLLRRRVERQVQLAANLPGTGPGEGVQS